MAGTGKLWDMPDEDLIKLADENSAKWHTVGEKDQAKLHEENTEINKVLDSRRGEKTTFDPDSGTWSPRKESSAGIKQTAGGTGGSQASFSYQTAPEYASKYDGLIQDMSQQILGREDFSYDPETDPLYQQYKEQYTRNGKLAMEDTLGQVSARTGGLASSYAGSAAQQSYNQYMAALGDKIPELRQLAYEMYRDEGDAKRADLNMLLALEQGEYGKYQDRLGQYNADRSFGYGAWSDQRSFDYKMDRDKLEDQRYEDEWNYTLDREAKQDEINAHEREVSEAADIYSATGDVTRLAAAWGLSPESAQVMIDDYAQQKQLTKDQAAIQLAKEKAAIGDLSGYKSMNWDTGYMEAMQNHELQQAAAELARIQGGGDETSGAYDTILKRASGYENIQDAKEYLERMVDGGYISGDAAAYIYQVELGGIAQEKPDFQGKRDKAIEYMQRQGAGDAAAFVMTESEWSRRKNSYEMYGQGGAAVTEYASYEDYLNDYVQDYLETYGRSGG